jgi:hypothetical protein
MSPWRVDPRTTGSGGPRGSRRPGGSPTQHLASSAASSDGTPAATKTPLVNSWSSPAGIRISSAMEESPQAGAAPGSVSRASGARNGKTPKPPPVWRKRTRRPRRPGRRRAVSRARGTPWPCTPGRGAAPPARRARRRRFLGTPARPSPWYRPEDGWRRVRPDSAPCGRRLRTVAQTEARIVSASSRRTPQISARRPKSALPRWSRPACRRSTRRRRSRRRGRDARGDLLLELLDGRGVSERAEPLEPDPGSRTAPSRLAHVLGQWTKSASGLSTASGGTNTARAPKSVARSRLPSGASGAVPRSPSTQRSPRRAARTAVARAQFDWSAPTVIRVSAPCSSASCRRNSSFRALLPLSANPVRSSRLTLSSSPSAAPRRGSGWIGVGVAASETGAGAWQP